MRFYLCFFLIFTSEKVASTDNATKSEHSSLPSNGSAKIETQRITQPSAQSQLIERTLIVSNSTSDTAKSDFKPSPHLETYYEYNKFPVPPAMPEAKHFSHYNLGEQPAVQWPQTSEQSWTARIKFPTTKERPYQFYNQKSSEGTTYPVFDSFPSKPTEDWSKFMESQKKKELVQKHQFDFSAPVYDSVEKPPSKEVEGSHWKKIVKFLTAVIPIGLLISALTPTVITVQNITGTQMRSRAEKTLVSSLSYFNSIGCEDRVLCELVLSASVTENAERDVENLLNTFTEEGKAVEKAEEMRRIFEAVKNRDCRPIVCEKIKEKT